MSAVLFARTPEGDVRIGDGTIAELRAIEPAIERALRVADDPSQNQVFAGGFLDGVLDDQ